MVIRIESGKLVSWDDHKAQSYVDSAIFTTTLLERLDAGENRPALARIRALEFHLDRLLGSAHGRFGFDTAHLATHPEHDRATLHQIVVSNSCHYLRSDSTKRTLLRVTIDNEGSLLELEPWEPRWSWEHGITAWTVSGTRPKADIKNADRSASRSAASIAESRGFEEALLVGSTGVVHEGAWTNFFWFNRRGELITPATVLLPGVTRRMIMLHEPCQIRDVTLAEVLSEAVEAFLTQATHGIMPLRAINDTPLGDGTPGTLTRSLQERFANYQPLYDTVLSCEESTQ